ncbi:hypothetical protein ACFSCX_09860 [Bacillus salitolerans]|uniref:Uncharacterized protein n=1 Tax=Bacillus salitolerans TaxID=1437434 RepID=A0ABW4LQ98_9BACI
MRGKDLLEAIDLKKLTIVELQIKFEELKEKYPEKKRLYMSHKQQQLKRIYKCR